MGKNIANALVLVLVATISILAVMLVLSTIVPLANMARHGFDWSDLLKSFLGVAMLAGLWKFGKPRSGVDFFFLLAAVFGADILMDALTNGFHWRTHFTPLVLAAYAGYNAYTRRNSGEGPRIN